MPAEVPRANLAPAAVASSADSAALGPIVGKSSSDARQFFPFLLQVLLAGVAAGSLSAFTGEKTFNLFPLDPHYPASYASTTGYDRAAMRSVVLRDAQQVVEMKKATAAFGSLGLLLGVAMGATGWLSRGSNKRGLLGVLVGGATGALAGAGLSAAIIPVYFRFMDPTRGFILLFCTYAAVFAGVGLACGLALGLALGAQKVMSRCLIGGLVGSLVGTFAFAVINSLAFPLLGAFEPVPAERIPRLVVHLCVAIGIAAVAGLAAGRAVNRSALGP